MRILHLRLKNLNSLVGEWSIDFTHPDYESNGIFAIVGPTGAGKSTLLDAICLALYGKTPRLDKISASSNEVMARQTGECFAEVTFETSRGKYRSFWGQHRSRKKPGEKLQEPQREIVDAITNAVLENKKSNVDNKVEEITGMDFHRFSRSMLLAQGNFDAFLKASPSDRAPILEQITGTEIYSKISIKVFERAKEEAERLKALEESYRMINILPEDVQQQYAQDLDYKTKSVGDLKLTLEELQKNKNWRFEIDKISQDLQRLESQWILFLEEEKNSQDLLKKLERANKALNYEGDYKDFCNLEKRCAEYSLNLAKATNEMSSLNIDKKKEVLDSFSKNFDELLKDQLTTLELIKKVRKIDVDITIQSNNLKQHSESILREEEKLNHNGRELNTSQCKEAECVRTLASLKTYFEEHPADESLIEKFSSIEENLDRFNGKKLAITSHLEKVEATQLQMKDLEKQVYSTEKAYEALKITSEQAENALKEIAAEYDQLSEGRDGLQWKNELKALELQEDDCSALKENLEACQTHEENRKKLSDAINALKIQREEFQKKAEAAQNEKELLEQKIEDLQHQQQLRSKMQTLSEERQQLSEGAPCPLCGSLDHPYAQGKSPDLSKIDIQLKEVKAAENALQKVLQKLTKEISDVDTKVCNYGEKKSDAVKQALQLNEKNLNLCEKLGFCKSIPSHEEISKFHEYKLFILKEFEEKYEAYLKKGKDKEKAQKDFNDRSYECSKLAPELNDIKTKLLKCENDLKFLKQEGKRLEKEHTELEDLLLENLRMYGIFTLTHIEPSSIKKDLSKRFKKWKDHKNEWEQAENQLKQEQSRITFLKNDREKTEKALKTFKEEKKQQHDSMQRLLVQRQSLFGSKDPDKVEEILKQRVDKDKIALDSIKEDYNKAVHEQESLVKRIAELDQSIEDSTKELKQKEDYLTTQIHDAGFSDLADFKHAILNHQERENLARSLSALDSKKSELQNERRSAEKRLAELSQESKTKDNLLDLEKQIKDVLAKLTALNEEIGALKCQLNTNEEKKESAKKIQMQIEQQSKETDLWKSLSNLIGSSDGKKFRDSAQKMTLEMMIAHANRQLIKMSDRYLLRQSKDVPLDLEVVDNYQAGEERSVKNLSGGEGFIVSLSLALGLSQMSSSKVRVDTLFLDEGFGTLDERALEFALDTLSELHQEGKVIGLISHVNVLKERISTQITVLPISGGRSRIEGPGCRAHTLI